MMTADDKRYLTAGAKTCLVFGVIALLTTAFQPPPIGFTTRAKVVGALDGDTIVVEIRRTMHVRMTGVWCPETRTKNAAEKKRGLAAKAFVEKLALDKECTLHIPAFDPSRLGDETSMSRVLGQVWLAGDDVPLSERVVTAGHGKRTKGEK